MIRAAALLLTFALLTGCASSQYRTEMAQIPHYTNAWQIKKTDSWPPVHNVSLAIRMFYERWKEDFGDPNGRVHEALNKLMIEWVEPHEKNVLGYSIDGKMIRGRAKGLALSPTYIKVRKTVYKRLASTSLIHELTHVALWNSGNILGDPDHEGEAYRGWTSKHTKMIKDLNRILADINI